MSKKTERKNKTKLVVNYPTTAIYLIEDIFAMNEGEKPITLRVRHQKEMLDTGKAAEIGCRTGEQGRPKKVFALTPITQTLLDEAEANHVSLVDANRLAKLLNLPAIPVFTPMSEPVPA